MIKYTIISVVLYFAGFAASEFTGYEKLFDALDLPAVAVVMGWGLNKQFQVSEAHRLDGIETKKELIKLVHLVVNLLKELKSNRHVKD